MEKYVLAVLVMTMLSLSAVSRADESTPLVGNYGIASNYVFRGISQTSEQTAFQGGLDQAGATGAYYGIWISNISWLKDSGAYTSSHFELDGYGGYKGAIGRSDFGYDVGGIAYYYDGQHNGNNANTAEIYGALTWQWLSAKLSYPLTDYFGILDSKGGTYYVDLSANYPLGKTGITLLVHAGHLKLSGSAPASADNDSLYAYTDWKLGASYSLAKDTTIGAYYTGTNAIAANYTFLGKNWADSQYVIYLQQTF